MSRISNNLSQHRNVKVVATLGPSSSDYCQIKALVRAGVNVFRLNMSHGTHKSIAQTHEFIRNIEQELKLPIAILGDLQGPKLRCGVFEEHEYTLKNNSFFTFDLNPDPGDINRVELPHPEIFEALEKGDILLVNDGQIKLEVNDCSSSHARCRVIIGGNISSRKGVNVPSVVLPLSSLSQKDKKDLQFLCRLGIDWLALSFVQRLDDVLEAKEIVGDAAKIISKIEKPAAVNTFEQILENSDGIMIARGDLGVEMPVQKLPALQKRLVRQCREAGKPVIVATQMLESMITSPFPTRAEISDVATAIYEGADAIMLSAESAAGCYPVEAVSTMVDVAHEIEADTNYRSMLEAGRGKGSGVYQNPLTVAAREIADNGDISAICCFTQSGSTALSAARERPCVPVIALTSVEKTARQLCLSWGLRSRVIEPVSRFKNAVSAAIDAALILQLAEKNDTIAVTAGLPMNTSGSTNILRLAKMDGSDLYQSELA